MAYCKPICFGSLLVLEYCYYACFKYRNMETLISGILIFMIAGALFALHARDLLSALIAQGLVGYGLVICFLVLRAPDLAIVQIVVETITLIFMVAIVLDSTRKELQTPPGWKER